MVRRYEVWIGGKPLVIGGCADALDGRSGSLAVRIDADEEILPAVAMLGDRPELARLTLFADDVEHVWKRFAGHYKHVQAAGGCVTDEHGRLLAIKRLGVWDLPKGKLEKGERSGQGAVREVQEECGLKRVDLVRDLCATWHTYERNGKQHLKRTDWYLMRASSNEKLKAQTEEDITDVRWVDADGMAELRANTYPSLQAVLSAWEEALGPA